MEFIFSSVPMRTLTSAVADFGGRRFLVLQYEVAAKASCGASTTSSVSNSRSKNSA